MRIRTRTMLVVVIVVSVVWTGSLLVAGNVALRALQQRENLEVQATLMRADEAVALQVDQLQRTSKDWSVWDDTYRYVQDRNPEFVSSNLGTVSLEQIDVDFMGFLDGSGRVVRVVSLDATPGVAPGIPSSVEVLLTSKPEIAKSGAAGVLATSRGPLMVSVQPVLRSDGTGPSVGTLFLGTYLEMDEVDQLSRVTGAPVSLSGMLAVESQLKSRPDWSDPAARLAGVAVPTSRDSVTGYKQVRGLDRDSSLVVSITQPRTTMILARETGSYLLVAGLLASGALVISLIVSTDFVVTNRLERLSADVRSVSQANDFSARVTALGDDELTELAEDINSMLSALQKSQRELEYLADHDALTKLYNRHRFEEDLDRELAEQTRTGGRGALLWLDIDNFKEINDSLGHATGDRVLAELSQELKDETRGYASLARVGGDEFGLILPTADRLEAEMAADRLVNLIRAHVFQVEEHRIEQQVSIGIALYPEHGMAADDLLACADIAMYDAKKSGGNGYCVYNG